MDAQNGLFSSLLTNEVLRDRFATEYLRHRLADEIPLRSEFHEIARDAYAFADAALDAREARKRKEAA